MPVVRLQTNLPNNHLLKKSMFYLWTFRCLFVNLRHYSSKFSSVFNFLISLFRFELPSDMLKTSSGRVVKKVILSTLYISRKVFI